MATLSTAKPAHRRHAFAWWQIVTHLFAVAPLAVLLIDAVGGRLGANPIQEATLRTGKTALVFLVLSLVCTPLNAFLGIRQAIKLRRPLGVYGALYAAVHVFIFIVLDYVLDIELILLTVAEKPFVVAGLAAFLLLVPLAITSTDYAKKKLKKNWIMLHKLVYLAVPLAVVHYWWLVKADIRVPLQFGVVVALLLLVRLPPVRAFMVRVRYRLTQSINGTATQR